MELRTTWLRLARVENVMKTLPRGNGWKLMTTGGAPKAQVIPVPLQIIEIPNCLPVMNSVVHLFIIL